MATLVKWPIQPRLGATIPGRSGGAGSPLSDALTALENVANGFRSDTAWSPMLVDGPRVLGVESLTPTGTAIRLQVRTFLPGKTMSPANCGAHPKRICHARHPDGRGAARAIGRRERGGRAFRAGLNVKSKKCGGR